jgi:hypothetical protein
MNDNYSHIDNRPTQATTIGKTPIENLSKSLANMDQIEQIAQDEGFNSETFDYLQRKSQDTAHRISSIAVKKSVIRNLGAIKEEDNESIGEDNHILSLPGDELELELDGVLEVNL